MASREILLTARRSVPLIFTRMQVPFFIPHRSMKGKHVNPKFNEMRRMKLLEEFEGRFPFPLPDYRQMRENVRRDDARLGLEKLKREGMLPPQSFRERPINITSTFAIADPYVPPEGDGSKSLLSKKGVKDRGERAKQWTQCKRAVRKINKIEKDIGGFAPEYFCEEAVDIYIQAHNALETNNRTRLHELVTSKCFKKISDGLQYKTLRWRFLRNVEPARLVHAAVFEFGPEGNSFAQVTIRIHSEQTIAIYDRFGRLVYGSLETPRSVLEFVVFEKRISDTYGLWRMHGKIEPEWADSKPPVIPTFRLPDVEKIHAAELEKLQTRDVLKEMDEEEEAKTAVA